MRAGNGSNYLGANWNAVELLAIIPVFLNAIIGGKVEWMNGTDCTLSAVLTPADDGWEDSWRTKETVDESRVGFVNNQFSNDNEVRAESNRPPETETRNVCRNRHTGETSLNDTENKGPCFVIFLIKREGSDFIAGRSAMRWSSANLTVIHQSHWVVNVVSPRLYFNSGIGRVCFCVSHVRWQIELFLYNSNCRRSPNAALTV